MRKLASVKIGLHDGQSTLSKGQASFGTGRGWGSEISISGICHLKGSGAEQAQKRLRADSEGVVKAWVQVGPRSGMVDGRLLYLNQDVSGRTTAVSGTIQSYAHRTMSLIVQTCEGFVEHVQLAAESYAYVP
jgi:hypothetical protein